jgi:hypothetical protein
VGRVLARSQVFSALASVAALGCLAPALLAATPPRDRLASGIENRLNLLGDTTFQMTQGEGYFYRNPILPERAFYTYGGCRQAYKLVVYVYKTTAQAIQMYGYFHQHVVDIGGDFHAFDMVRRGRVIYSANTAPAPDPNAPAVPTRDFHSLVDEVSAPLPAHPRGCTPSL